MMRVLVLSIFFGLILADPAPMISSSQANLDLDATMYEVEGETNKRVARLVPDTTSLVFELISALIGQKFNALSLAVSVIHWLVSNCVVIVIGAAAALGFCKLTGKCSLNYENVLPVPVSQLTSYVTPDHIETAERFLVSAVEKYAEERRRRSSNPMIY